MNTPRAQFLLALLIATYISIGVFVRQPSRITVSTDLGRVGASDTTPTPNPRPQDYGLTEGDIISSYDYDSDLDIFIVNELGYKRLFLNPIIFEYYGHFAYADVQSVTPGIRDLFITSGLFRNCETNDDKVYALEVMGEDTGILHHVKISGNSAVSQDPEFFKKVFCINTLEYNWYPKSAFSYTSLSQVPVYYIRPTPTPSATPIPSRTSTSTPSTSSTSSPQTSSGPSPAASATPPRTPSPSPSRTPVSTGSPQATPTPTTPAVCVPANPNTNITRAEAVTFIGHYHVSVAKDWQWKSPFTSYFTDVPYGHPYYTPIETAKAYSFIVGVSNGNGTFSFIPNEEWKYGFCGITKPCTTPPGVMTRGQFVKALYDYGLANGKSSFCSSLLAPVPTPKTIGTTSTGAITPLRVLASNPRYFTNDGVRAVYLTGSHTWYNLQDISPNDPPRAFNYAGYLDFMKQQNHNFMRMWLWSVPNWVGNVKIAPLEWERTGPGNAADGKPKFNLDRFNQAFFDRLRQRVIDAKAKGIYVDIMLFEGYDAQELEVWAYNPFKSSNNINSVNGTGGEAFWGTSNAKVLQYQEAFVRKVIDTVNDQDNVLFEICNECSQASYNWQVYMVDFIHNYERTKDKQHPVGMSSGPTMGQLYASRADWVTPSASGYNKASNLYIANPPAADGRKVEILDTDHLGRVVFQSDLNLGRTWAWKSFTRGLNPIILEPIPNSIRNGNMIEVENSSGNTPGWSPMRRAIGDTLRYASRMNLATAIPTTTKCSSTFWPASSTEMIVYIPSGGAVTINMTGMGGLFNVEWFNPRTSVASAGTIITASDSLVMRAPDAAGDWVLYIKK